MRAYLSSRALRDLDAIFAHMAAENPAAAWRIVERVEQIRALLAEHPRMGRKLPRGPLRRFPVHPFPYLIYYEIRGKDLRIIRVRHAARFRRALHDPDRPFSP
jgi:toxin ParE1/3/4